MGQNIDSEKLNKGWCMVEFNAKLIGAKEHENNKENQIWWENNPMTYDWEGQLGELELTREYFKSIDKLFGEGHSLVNNPSWPNGYILEKFIPYAELNGKKVLEIGCGAGLVASHLVMAGSNLHAIDLTEKAVKITKKRFEVFGLNGTIQQMDAEELEFDRDTFDRVVSWGVIHHSGNLKGIINQIYRVLKPGGKVYLMVYNKNSLRYQVFCRLWHGVARLEFLNKNLDEIAGSITDGYIARHLTEKEIKLIARKFSHIQFSYSDEVNTISSYLLGPFYRFLKPFPHFKKKFEKEMAKKWGWYMEIVLTK